MNNGWGPVPGLFCISAYSSCQISRALCASCIALDGGLAQPLYRLMRVFGDPFSLGVHTAEILLRIGIALIRSQPVPPDRFGVVYWVLPCPFRRDGRASSLLRRSPGPPPCGTISPLPPYPSVPLCRSETYSRARPVPGHCLVRHRALPRLHRLYLLLRAAAPDEMPRRSAWKRISVQSPRVPKLPWRGLPSPPAQFSGQPHPEESFFAPF